MANENMNQGPAVPLKAAEEDFRSAAGATADEYLDRGKEVWNDAVQRVRSVRGDTEQYVRKDPAKAVFTAVGVGFVLGLIFRRYRHMANGR
jgi:ElaB/YqjD/DUF883 family membrane-anchored ribosome-binding protein